MKKTLTLTPFVKRHISWAILVFAVVGALGRWFYDHRFPSWDEEVLLSDGRMITVHRAHKFNTERRLIETSLSLDLPEIKGAQTWREFLYPAIVDVYEGKLYVVGHVTYKSAWQYKDPKYGYVAFTYSALGWQRVPFISVPAPVRREENIAFCTAQTGLIRTWTSKQSGWCNLQGDFVLGAKRVINLQEREQNAKEIAELSGTTIKSE